MGDNTNLFTLSESAINAIKKPELVQKIIALKGKVIVDADIYNLCSLCHRLPVSRYSRDSNKRVIVKFVNRKHPEALLRNKSS